MPISKNVKDVWNKWRLKEGKGISDHWLKAEQIVEENILQSLGFDYIIRFSKFNLRKGTQYRLFTFDIYAERKKEKWLIDVTTKANKVLEIPMMKVLKRIGITNFGVVCVKKDFSEYVFKEAFIKDNQKTITLRVNKDDFVLGNVKKIPKILYKIENLN